MNYKIKIKRRNDRLYNAVIQNHILNIVIVDMHSFPWEFGSRHTKHFLFLQKCQKQFFSFKNAKKGNIVPQNFKILHASMSLFCD